MIVELSLDFGKNVSQKRIYKVKRISAEEVQIIDIVEKSFMGESVKTYKTSKTDQEIKEYFEKAHSEYQEKINNTKSGLKKGIYTAKFDQLVNKFLGKPIIDFNKK